MDQLSFMNQQAYSIAGFRGATRRAGHGWMA